MRMNMRPKDLIPHAWPCTCTTHVPLPKTTPHAWHRSTKRCMCKTGCLKRYCVCFDAGGLCGPDCGCIDCANHSANV